MHLIERRLINGGCSMGAVYNLFGIPVSLKGAVKSIFYKIKT